MLLTTEQVRADFTENSELIIHVGKSHYNENKYRVVFHLDRENIHIILTEEQLKELHTFTKVND